MVMQTLCEVDNINHDYNGSAECFQEASSMLFVYSIAWHIMFWSYGFPLLKTLSSKVPDDSISITNDNDTSTIFRLAKDYISISWFKTVAFSPSMIAIYFGLIIGLTPALQVAFFKPSSSDFFSGTLRPFGLAILTLGQPLICVNCFVMSASLAHTKLNISTQVHRIRYYLETFLFNDESIKEKDAKHAGSIPYSATNECETQSTISPLAEDNTLNGSEKKSVPQLRTVATHLLCR